MNLVNDDHFFLSMKNIQSISTIGSKTAKCFCVCYQRKGDSALNCIFEKNCNKKVEIASITKIMTGLVVLKIVELFRLDIKV